MTTGAYRLGSQMRRNVRRPVGRESWLIVLSGGGRTRGIFTGRVQPLPYHGRVLLSSVNSANSNLQERLNARGISVSSGPRYSSQNKPEADSNKDNLSGSSAPNAKYFDCVIAGGGLVGTTMAVALGKSTLMNNRALLVHMQQ